MAMSLPFIQSSFEGNLKNMMKGKLKLRKSKTTGLYFTTVRYEISILYTNVITLRYELLVCPP